MKRLLYIAYFFPPLGGAGVQRSLKFARYLPEFGWEPTVLTSRSSYWMEDASLLNELPPGADVLRVAFWGGGARAAASAKRGQGGTQSSGSPPAGGARSYGRIRLLRGISRFFLLPDAYIGWTLRAASHARRELRRRPYQALLTTSSPDSAHLLGRRLKRESGLPWVADFRDPWTRRLSYQPPSRWHDSAQRRMERACLLEADRIVVTTEETKADFLRLVPELPPEKIAVIPNGYDEEDFLEAERMLADPAVAATSFSEPVLHAGQLNPERPITPYLEALRIFLQRWPGRAAEAKTLFLGGHYDRHLEEVRARGLEGWIRFAPGRPHGQSVLALLRARLLLLFEQNSERGRLVLPGKTFEYLRAGKPILAIVPPDGAAARMVREMRAGLVADPAKPAEVAEALAALLSPDAPPRALPEEAARFERRRLTAELAGLLDSLT